MNKANRSSCLWSLLSVPLGPASDLLNQIYEDRAQKFEMLNVRK